MLAAQASLISALFRDWAGVNESQPTRCARPMDASRREPSEHRAGRFFFDEDEVQDIGTLDEGESAKCTVKDEMG